MSRVAVISSWAKLLSLLALSVLLSACLEANLKLEVKPDGSVIQTLTLTEPHSHQANGELLANFVKQLQAQGWQVRREGNKTVATRRMENTGETTLGTNVFLEERFQLRQTGWWLVEDYRLEMRLGQPNPIFASLLPAGQILSLFTRALIPKLSLSLETPLTARQHNADRFERRSYTWQVSLDRPNEFYIEYRVVRWDRIMWIGVGLGLLVMLGRLWARPRRP